jgi:hypothetical protein
MKERAVQYVRMPSMSAERSCHLVFAFAIAHLGLAISQADAATCVDGKPTFGKIDAPQSGCDCFDKDPPGTRIFALYGVFLNVMTPAARAALAKDSALSLTVRQE